MLTNTRRFPLIPLPTHYRILVKALGALLTALLLGFAVTSCGEQGTTVISGPGQQDPASLQTAGGDAQTGTVGAALADPISVQVATKSGKAVSGATVSWTFQNGTGSTTLDGTGSQAFTTKTDGSGMSSVYWTLDTIAGDQWATATLTGVQGAPSQQSKFRSHGKPSQPDSIDVSPKSATLTVGEPLQLKANVLDKWGNLVTDAKVKWHSGNSGVAKVDSTGMVTAETEGTDTITASSGPAVGHSSLVVTATTSPSVVNVTADSQAVTLAALGATAQLTATATDAAGNAVPGATFNWTALNSAVATVNASGLVTAQTNGTAQVVVTAAGSSAADTVGVTVSQVATQITISPSSLSLQVDSTSQLTTSVLDANSHPITGATVTWSSGDTSVATVTAQGLVTAIAQGSTMVVATTSGASTGPSSISGEASVTVATTVSDPGTVTDLRVASVTDSSVTLRWTQVGDGTGSPANYVLRYATPTLVWGSASSTEVSVSGTAIGSAISYTFNGLQSATSYQFALTSYRGTLNVDAVFGAQSNVVTGLTSGSGATQTPTVTVTPSSLSFSSLGATAQLTAVAKDSLGNTVSNPGFTWRSLASSIATVSSTGLVTAQAVGATAIVVTAACCGSDTVSVDVSTSGTGQTLLSEGFEDGNLASRGWFDETSVSIANDARPGSPGTHSLQWHWATGAVAPQGSSRIDFTPGNSVYVSYWIKFSSNWVGSGEPWHPHMFHVLTTADDHYIGPSITHLTLYDEMLYLNGNLVGQLAVQDALMIDENNLNVDLFGVTENHSVGGYNGQHEFDDATSTVSWDLYLYSAGQHTNYKFINPRGITIADADKNQWHHIESYWQLNSIVNGIGQQDGVLQYWVDGVLRVDRHDVYYRTGANPTMQFRTFVMAPYIGDGSPADQSIWVDDLLLATKRP